MMLTLLASFLASRCSGFGLAGTTRRAARPASSLSSVVSSAPGALKLTLYRDNNAWCPFCEKVWIALEAKNVEFDVVLINLYDKPEWYKEMVPSTKVPAIELHDASHVAGERGSGEVVYESQVILERLDALFPAVALRSSEEPSALARRVTSSSFAYVYANASVTCEDKAQRKLAFHESLAELDAHLLRDGPFVAGDVLSAADLEIVPMLERYRYQLPLLVPGEPPLLEQRPGLEKWFQALEANDGYNKVRGDEYSWTAATSSFLRIFSNASDASTVSRIFAADQAATRVLESARKDEESLEDMVARVEAADKLATNRAYIIGDACDASPSTQKHLERCVGRETAVEATLKAAEVILRGEGEMSFTRVDPAAAKYVASRVCVPRDMSAAAARALRHVLMAIARA